MKKWLLTIATILVLPTAALAQSADAATQASSFWMSLFMTLLPIFFIGVFIWLFFIRGIRRLQNTQVQEYRQHREKVEQLLERIAKAVEERNGRG